MNQIAATIEGQTFHYDTLTIDRVYLYTLKMQDSRPDHLFLTEAGERTLSTILRRTHKKDEDEPKKIPALHMLFGMYVVVLPTLPENTLIIGKLVLHPAPQLTRDQIETISEQAIQRMKEKRIELDWNEA
jgi:hypothetical protein